MKNIKTKIYSISLLLASFGYGYSQNLVINSDMNAMFISNGYAEITKTTTWSNANGGTVDLFDKNKSSNCYIENAIPTNYMGYQPLFKTGQNYAGIIAYYDDGSNNRTDSIINAKLNLKDGYKLYSEYLQGEIAEPLIGGKIYEISFKVSLADKSARAVSCLGALLTPTKMDQKSNSFLKETPQFITHRIISDSINWVTVYGAYIATGGEKFITIGCFKDEYFQVEKTVTPLQNDSRKAYYYITDVAITPYLTAPNLDAIIVGVDYIEVMNLQFATESADIAPQFHKELDEIATWMINHPAMSFFIAGYTDKTGTNSINEPLSLKRAKEVKKYFTAKGVNEGNIIVDGFGSNDPVEYKIKSRKNRRVEIYLYSTQKISLN
jgi:outer membrane protein OmpA-like peptidoglycan-associated protein